MKNERYSDYRRHDTSRVSDIQYDCGRGEQFEKRWFRLDGKNNTVL